MAADDDERQRRDDAEEERHYWESIEDERRAEDEQEAQRRETAIEDMERWFFEQFEDPQNQMPRDGEDQVFIYPWGGPFEASDVLHGQFGADHPESLVLEAVARIERDGTTEWAPTDTGDYYEHPGYDAEATASDRLGQQLKEQIFDRLNALEAVIAELPGLPGNIGHNAPPSEIGLPPYTEEDASEVAAAIHDTRAALADETSDPETLARLSGRFAGWGAKIGVWLTKKGDLAVDEFIKNAIKAGTWATAFGLLGEVAHGLMDLAKHLLSHP
jgi:hypothetical protein